MKFNFKTYLPMLDIITLGFCLAIIIPTTIKFVVPGQIERILSLITPEFIFTDYLYFILNRKYYNYLK